MKKIFCGGLPRSITDEKLKEIFSAYGEIHDYVIMKDVRTKESRGFGFVEFVSEECADKVLESRPVMIEGREIEVRRALPKEISANTIHDRTTRIFLGGLSYEITEDDIKNHYEQNFSKYGKVVSVEIKRNKDTNVSRGFGFVSFDNNDMVDAVLISEPRPLKFGKNCEVKKSEPRTTEPSGSRRRRNDRHGSPGDRRRLRYDERDRRSPRIPETRGMGGRYPYMSRSAPYGRSPPRHENYYVDIPAYPPPHSYDRPYSHLDQGDFRPPYAGQRAHPPRGYEPRPFKYEETPPLGQGQNMYTSRDANSHSQRRHSGGYRGLTRNPY